MSLPDTVFIFVLALIIFGPKKLPEIGRQLGRLVGEFRRASNEFKFQIEEELRQVDFAEKRSTQPKIAAPADDTATASEASDSTALALDSQNPAENIPVGQHPNIDTLDTSEFDTSAVDPYGFHAPDTESTNAEHATDQAAAEMTESAIPPQAPKQDTVPTITPAEGSQPRTTAPFAAIDSAKTVQNVPVQQPMIFDDDLSSPKESTPTNHHPAPAEAEVTHG